MYQILYVIIIQNITVSNAPPVFLGSITPPPPLPGGKVEKLKNFIYDVAKGFI